MPLSFGGRRAERVGVKGHVQLRGDVGRGSGVKRGGFCGVHACPYWETGEYRGLAHMKLSFAADAGGAACASQWLWLWLWLPLR